MQRAQSVDDPSKEVSLPSDATALTEDNNNNDNENNNLFKVFWLENKLTFNYEWWQSRLKTKKKKNLFISTKGQNSLDNKKFLVILQRYFIN